MADYIYLLENRLSPAQRAALSTLREVARSKALTIFLVGGAVRDLTSGSPVRDLDVVVQGNALKLRKDIEKLGGATTGESEVFQSLYVNFPGNVRAEVGSTLSLTFPKPGKAVAKPATILEDLRRRDFTVNAMALSLNDGSYGLLMDPLNGVADIENRQLRLVSNYGFIEDPVRMIRATRLGARLGWTMDEKTQTRYETGKQEGYIGALAEFHRGYETEEIVHEEDPLRVLKRLEAEGWMKFLAPYWTSAKANVPELERLREAQTQLQMQGIQPDTSAAHFPLLTAKLSAQEVQTLKESFPRQGFVLEIERLEAHAKDFANQLSGKGAALPSQAWKLITGANPEAVLWVAFSTKSAVLQAKFKSFASEWPLARQKMPYVMMQEMRIVPELADYDALLEKLFFELMDGKLQTPEEMKAFLEPFSPPAPPPPINMRRPRAAKKEAKVAKPRAKKPGKTPVDPDVSETIVAGGQESDSTSAAAAVETAPTQDSQAAQTKKSKDSKLAAAAAPVAPVVGKAAAKGTPAKELLAKEGSATKAPETKRLKATPAGSSKPKPAQKQAAKKAVAAKPVASKKASSQVVVKGAKSTPSTVKVSGRSVAAKSKKTQETTARPAAKTSAKAVLKKANATKPASRSVVAKKAKGSVKVDKKSAKSTKIVAPKSLARGAQKQGAKKTGAQKPAAAKKAPVTAKKAAVPAKKPSPAAKKTASKRR